MDKNEQLLNEEQQNMLKEIKLAVYELLLEDEFGDLYTACEKLQRRLDALDEAFYRLCDEHNLNCY